MDNRTKVISLIDTLNINKWKKKIEHKLEHHFLDLYVNRPKIDEEKLRVLSLIFHKHPELSECQIERYIIATMLVQTALDTHVKRSIKRTRRRLL